MEALPLKTVDEVMTKEVVALKPKDKLIEAVKLMKKRGIGSIVVLEDKKVRGIITEKDIVKLAAEKVDFEDTKIEDVMSTPVATLSSGTPVQAALKLMKGKGIRHLPIVRDGELVGLISMRDLSWQTVIDAIHLSHLLFMAYVKSVGDILKTGAIIFAPRFVEEAFRFFGQRGVVIKPEEDPERVLAEIQRYFEAIGMPATIRLTKIGPDKYVFSVENCEFARETHPLLKDTNTVCWLTLIATTILKYMTGKEVQVSFSKFGERGSKTELTIK